MRRKLKAVIPTIGVMNVTFVGVGLGTYRLGIY
jgi:hypothetical protein